MPKSSSLTCPSALTSTFEGFRSRWTTRLACAWATAASTSRNRRMRASTPSACVVAVAIDRLAVDVLEDEVRLAARRDAGVDQPGDVRVGQPREQAAFAPEPLLAARRAGAHQREVQQLDRGAALEAAVRALGQPDRAHAAVPDRRDQPIGADGVAGERHLLGRRDGALFEKALFEHGPALVEELLEVGRHVRLLARAGAPARRARSSSSRSSARSR